MPRHHCHATPASPAALTGLQPHCTEGAEVSEPAGYTQKTTTMDEPAYVKLHSAPNLGNSRAPEATEVNGMITEKYKVRKYLTELGPKIYTAYKSASPVTLWVEVCLQFVFLVLLLVGISLSPQDPFPMCLVVMDCTCALLQVAHYCIYGYIGRKYCHCEDSYVFFLSAKLLRAWRAHFFVICALGSAFLGALLYAVVPDVRGTLLGVSYVAIGYVARFYMFTNSIRGIRTVLQNMKAEYEPFVTQLINSAVGLACHWLAVSTLLHVLVYNIYPSKPKNFNFFDTMYYICLCLINGPTENLIFDSTVARLVVITLVLAVFLSLPGEFFKLSRAHQNFLRNRDKLDLLVRRHDAYFHKFKFVVTGHLTLNSVMGLFSIFERNLPGHISATHPVLLLHNQPLEPELEEVLERPPWNTIVDCYQYKELGDHMLEQVRRLSTCVYILADYNASLKDTRENVLRLDEHNIQLGRRFSKWVQDCQGCGTAYQVKMQVVLHESLESAGKVCPEASVVCLDNIFSSLCAHSTAAFGFNTLAMLYGTALQTRFMKQFYETVKSSTFENPDHWKDSIGQAIALFSLNRGSFFMPRSLNPREEEFFDRVTKRELTPGSTYLGAKLCLRSASTTNTVLTAPIVKAIHKLGAALPHSPFFFTVLNPVDDYHRRNTQILYAKATCEPDAGILNLLSMARGTSSDSTSMERAGDDSHTVVIPDAEEVQATTEANSELCSTFDISQLSLEMPIESIYQSTGMDYTGSEKGKISALSCSGHLVICDYLNQISRQVLPFIRRARVIHNQPQLRVVLITNCPLNKALRKQLKGLGKLDIIRGTPHHANSLHRANVAQALAVVAFHWVDDTLPEVPVAIDDLSRRLREMDPRIPLIRFTSSFIFRCLKPTLEKFHKNPKRRFLEYWGALGSGEGIYMDLGYYLMCTVTNHDSINTILFPLAIPGSSYWTTLNLDQPPFTWSTSGSIGSSVYDDAKLTPTRSVTWEKLTQLLHEKNIVLVGLRRVFLSQKSVPIVAFIPPGSLPLYPKDQVILLVPRSSPLETLQIEL